MPPLSPVTEGEDAVCPATSPIHPRLVSNERLIVNPFCPTSRPAPTSQRACQNADTAIVPSTHASKALSAACIMHAAFFLSQRSACMAELVT